MTNGEKLKEVFPNMRIDVFESYVQVVGENYEFNNLYPLKWWNAEYKEPTTKENSGVDAVSRVEVLKLMQDNWHTHNGDWAMQESMDDIRALPSVTPQEPIEKCKWIKYDHRTMCPKEHIDVDSPYWRIPENRMEALKYCPYCGKEIEVEK